MIRSAHGSAAGWLAACPRPRLGERLADPQVLERARAAARREQPEAGVRGAVAAPGHADRHARVRLPARRRRARQRPLRRGDHRLRARAGARSRTTPARRWTSARAYYARGLLRPRRGRVPASCRSPIRRRRRSRRSTVPRGDPDAQARDAGRAGPGSASWASGYDTNLTGVPGDFGAASQQSFNLIGIEPDRQLDQALRRPTSRRGATLEYSHPLVARLEPLRRRRRARARLQPGIRLQHRRRRRCASARALNDGAEPVARDRRATATIGQEGAAPGRSASPPTTARTASVDARLAPRARHAQTQLGPRPAAERGALPREHDRRLRPALPRRPRG